MAHSIKEKEVLLQEIHHRVKNNLSVISSLVNLQSSTIETPDEAIEALDETSKRIFSIALVHEHLYQSTDYSGIDMSEYLETLIGQLQDTITEKPKIKLATELDAISMNINRAVPTGLLVNELITNALKHAFPEQKEGEITVKMEKNNSTNFNLIVEDNGIGISEEQRESMESLGMVLIQTLVKQIDGKLAVTTENGTRFKITIPLT